MALSKITNLSITDDTILNADIKSSAAIALSKLATDPSNATNLASGTVPTARLGSGTASSSTFLRGDQTYAAAGGGKILQVVQAVSSTAVYVTTINTWADLISAQITPANSSNKILCMFSTWSTTVAKSSATTIDRIRLLRDTTERKYVSTANSGGSDGEYSPATSSDITYVDSPSTTSQVDYSIQTYREGSSGTYGCYYGYDSGTDGLSLILMEIDGT